MFVNNVLKIVLNVIMVQAHAQPAILAIVI